AKTKKALVDKLVVIDKELDSGNVTDDILLTHLDLTRNLNAIKQADQLDMAQKAKVRWAIEGDENLKYLHVIINKRRAQLDIRGVFSNGTWIMEPSLVKKEFVDHFAARFKQPISSRLKLNLAFPNQLSPDQVEILDSNVTVEEIKKAVWDCAVNEGVFNGLHINGSMHLSHLFYADDAIFLGECSDHNLENLIRILQCASSIGCKILSTPFMYLGVTVGNRMSQLSAWWSTIDKVHARLSKWKAKTLSVGGRLTLIKSVLSAVPLYSMSIYKVPKGVLHRLEMIRNRFFIGADDAEKRITWIAWDKALASKKHGAKGFNFFSQVKIRVGNGVSTRFWHDIWLGDLALCTRFPRIFALENNKGISVASKWDDPSFDSLFCRLVRDGVESQQWDNLLSLLSSVILDGCFRVKDFRTAIDDCFLPSSDESTRWLKYVPKKINIFAWRARHQRLPTRVNLAKRGVQIDSNSCP
nr:RNA-directed DNA polymerase, eukaryota [Tanacetum cinerariifolium]